MIFPGFPFDSSDTDPQDQSGKSVVGDQKIRPATEHEKRDTQALCHLHRPHRGILISGMNKITRRSSDSERGEWGERNIFLKI